MRINLIVFLVKKFFLVVLNVDLILLAVKFCNAKKINFYYLIIVHASKTVNQFLLVKLFFTFN